MIKITYKRPCDNGAISTPKAKLVNIQKAGPRLLSSKYPSNIALRAYKIMGCWPSRPVNKVGTYSRSDSTDSADPEQPLVCANPERLHWQDTCLATRVNDVGIHFDSFTKYPYCMSNDPLHRCCHGNCGIRVANKATVGILLEEGTYYKVLSFGYWNQITELIVQQGNLIPAAAEPYWLSRGRLMPGNSSESST